MYCTRIVRYVPKVMYVCTYIINMKPASRCWCVHRYLRRNVTDDVGMYITMMFNIFGMCITNLSFTIVACPHIQ